MEFFDSFIRPSLHDAYVGWGVSVGAAPGGRALPLPLLHGLTEPPPQSTAGPRLARGLAVLAWPPGCSFAHARCAAFHPLPPPPRSWTLCGRTCWR